MKTKIIELAAITVIGFSALVPVASASQWNPTNGHYVYNNGVASWSSNDWDSDWNGGNNWNNGSWNNGNNWQNGNNWNNNGWQNGNWNNWNNNSGNNWQNGNNWNNGSWNNGWHNSPSGGCTTNPTSGHYEYRNGIAYWVISYSGC